MKKLGVLTSIFVLALAVVSCVPQRKYAELDNNYQKSEEERKYLSGAVKDLETEKNELSSRNSTLQKEYSDLDNDYKNLQEDYDYLKGEQRKMVAFKNQLMQHMAQSAASSKAENQKLLNEMIRAQEDLQRKEDELKRKEADLRKLEAQLEGTRKDLAALDADLKKREARINELEKMIADKDAEVSRCVRGKAQSREWCNSAKHGNDQLATFCEY